jgi:hypothetical protein
MPGKRYGHLRLIINECRRSFVNHVRKGDLPFSVGEDIFGFVQGFRKATFTSFARVLVILERSQVAEHPPAITGLTKRIHDGLKEDSILT